MTELDNFIAFKVKTKANVHELKYKFEIFKDDQLEPDERQPNHQDEWLSKMAVGANWNSKKEQEKILSSFISKKVENLSWLWKQVFDFIF